MHLFLYVRIPTGLPLVYDFETKCIKLLDDGSYAEEDPLQRYNFGSAPELLFLPRTMRAGKGTFRSLSEAEGCYIADDGQVYCCDPLIRLPLKEEALISDAASSSNAVVSEAPNYAQPT